MDWKQLESYVTVVRCGSFTKAAEELYLSQPTISAHIQALEKEFNSKLIQRTTKSVEVTPHGWKVYEFACDVLEQQQVLRDRLQEQLVQELRIGAFTVPLVSMMPEALRDFRKMIPDARVLLEQTDSGTIINRLLYDQYDFGITDRDPQDSRLTAIPCGGDRLVLITPDTEKYRQMQQKPDWMRLLTGAPVILRGNDEKNGRHSADSLWKTMGIREEEMQISARIDDMMTICTMVAEELGIAIISEFAARHSSQAERLLTFPLPCSGTERSWYLVVKKDYVPKKYQQELQDFLLERLGKA